MSSPLELNIAEDSETLAVPSNLFTVSDGLGTLTSANLCLS